LCFNHLFETKLGDKQIRMEKESEKHN